MLRENLKDTAEIISNILSQEVEVPEASTPHVSLLGAIANFRQDDPLNSDLRKLLEMFVKYPGPTERLIQELELLSKDLTH